MSMRHTRDETTLVERPDVVDKPPSLYRVLLLDDDFTPMDFVVRVLEKIFHMDRPRATTIMLQVHQDGRGTCGVYPRDIAVMKVRQVVRLSREHQHPLQCTMEVN